MNDKKATQASTLIDSTENDTFYYDQNNNSYVEYMDDHWKTVFCQIESQKYRNKLRKQYLKNTNNLPQKTVLDNVVDYLSQNALEEGSRIKVFLRFGKMDTKYYIDCCNNQSTSIEIGSNGWNVKQKHDLPVRFRSPKTQLPIAVPIEHGDPSLFFKYLPFTDENISILSLVFLCSIPIRNIVRPIVGLEGTEGSGKTTVAKMLRSIFDPTDPDLLTFIKRDNEFALVLHQNAVPVFDNLSRLPVQITNMFCKAITGDGFSKRKLYTDTDLTAFSYRRPIIYTSLETPSTAPDFLDRRVLFELNRLSMDNRKEESLLWEGFNRDLPSILGGCLDLIVKALNIMPTLKLRNLPRLADFAKFGTAISIALGYSEDYFIKILNENVNKKKLEAAISDEPIIDALLQFANDNISWSGKSSKLFQLINKQYRPTGSRFNWPKSPEAFGQRIKQ